MFAGARSVALQGVSFGALGVALQGIFISPQAIIAPTGGVGHAGRMQGLNFNLPRPTLPNPLARQRHRRDEILWLKS